jgi:hypothetical protein
MREGALSKSDPHLGHHYDYYLEIKEQLQYRCKYAAEDEIVLVKIQFLASRKMITTMKTKLFFFLQEGYMVRNRWPSKCLASISFFIFVVYDHCDMLAFKPNFIGISILYIKCASWYYHFELIYTNFPFIQ